MNSKGQFWGDLKRQNVTSASLFGKAEPLIPPEPQGIPRTASLEIRKRGDSALGSDVPRQCFSTFGGHAGTALDLTCTREALGPPLRMTVPRNFFKSRSVNWDWKTSGSHGKSWQSPPVDQEELKNSIAESGIESLPWTEFLRKTERTTLSNQLSTKPSNFRGFVTF